MPVRRYFFFFFKVADVVVFEMADDRIRRELEVCFVSRANNVMGVSSRVTKTMSMSMSMLRWSSVLM